MKPTVLSHAAFAALFTASVLTSVNAVAKDGRDFAGHYSLTNVNDQGSHVELTLALHLFNNSGADLQQAVVTVRPSHAGPDVLGTFAPIKLWRSGRDIVVRQQLTIPREQYQRWSTGTQPSVFIGYSTEDGRQLQRWAQLSRRPIIPDIPAPPSGTVQ
jgi:hypothetical protein